MAKFIITLKFEGKEYKCEGHCWFDKDWKIWRSAYEYDSVRNCEHDYASLLPQEVTKDKEFGCEQKEVEVVDYEFID